MKYIDTYYVTCYNANCNKCNKCVTFENKIVTEVFMKANFLKKGMMIAAVTAAMLSPVETAMAAEGMLLTASINKEVNIDANALTKALVEVKKEAEATPAFAIKSAEEMQFELMLEGVAFANTDNFLFVYPEARESSDWVGKVYNMSKVTILEEKGEWVLVESGSVLGYVRASYILTGRDAIEAAKENLVEFYGEDVFTLGKEEILESFSLGETKQEERIRLAAEEAARIAAEKAAEEARIAAEKAAQLEKGKSVIEYARQFLGNPYVYGGTSLTRGTDCSGFVKSVYAHFGVGMPRTSYYMRSSGVSVSYDEMQPGDVVCYSGHVALYMGDGMIIHAANERDDITIDSVNYARIITIRRVL